MSICPDDGFCQSTNKDDHKEKFLHHCYYGKDCRLMGVGRHSELFIHRCPYESGCTMKNNAYHTTTFEHPGILSSVASLVRSFFVEDETEGKLQASLRCPLWDKCNKCRDKDHISQFYHPCCVPHCKSTDENHLSQFKHQCWNGERCTNTSTKHKIKFLHGDNKPKLFPCLSKEVDTPKTSITARYPSASTEGTCCHKPMSSNITNESANNTSSPYVSSIYPGNYTRPIHAQGNYNSSTTPYSTLYSPTSGMSTNERVAGTPSNYYVTIPNHGQDKYSTSMPSNSLVPKTQNNTVFVTTFNVLADAYAHPERYPSITDPYCLSWDSRKQNIFAYLKKSFDIICLQEVDKLHKNDFIKELEKKGNYHTVFTEKKYPKKDGLLMAFNKIRFKEQRRGEGDVLAGYPETYQYVVLKDALTNKTCIVLNCHLTYQVGDTLPREKQVSNLLTIISKLKERERAELLWCGDFNTTQTGKPIQLIEQSPIGLQRTHSDENGFWSFCSSKGENRLVDYIWFSKGLRLKEANTDHNKLPLQVIPNREV